MPWPKDPAARALALQRHRESSQRRWARPEQRQHAREKALAQFADPAARARVGAAVARSYAENPRQRRRLAIAMRGNRNSAGKPRRRGTRVNKAARLALIRARAQAMRK